MFFKRLSDVYDEETAENEQKYGDDIEFYPEDELHAIVIPQGCHWRDVRQTSEDVGKAIVDAMMGIEHANTDTLAGLFSSFDDANWTDKMKLSDERLKNLVEHMSELPVGNRNYSADVMEACIVICRKNKPLNRRGKVLFINARNEVTRKNSQSYLEPEHIQKIAQTYHDFAVEEGFSAIATTEEIEQHDSKLSIALYVRGGGTTDVVLTSDAIEAWKNASSSLGEEYQKLIQMIEAGDNNAAL